MKISDDYNAKVRLWALFPRVVAAGPVPKLPPFKKQSFRSHEEMNQWKQNLLRTLARGGPDHG